MSPVFFVPIFCVEIGEEADASDSENIYSLLMTMPMTMVVMAVEVHATMEVV